MAKYRVLPSTAHNYGASFISDSNIAIGDYAMSFLARAVAPGETSELRVNLLDGTVTAAHHPPEIDRSIEGYVAGFAEHVQASGADFSMIREASMRIRVAREHTTGLTDPEPLVRAIISCEVIIVDDRGKLHTGNAEEHWTCRQRVGFE